MKKTLKGYLLGFLSAALLMGTVTYAANTVRIVIDNKELIPTDVNGNRVDPIIVDGTTYLPVRALANAFGKAVYWDGPTHTVYLGNMNGELEYPTIKLEDMTSVGDDIKETNDLTDNYGNRYSYAITNYGYGYTSEFLLNMKYSRFKGTLYVPEGQHDDNTSYLTIEADGKTIYTSPAMTKISKPVNIDLDITGCNDIKLKFNKKQWNDLWICLGDAGFYQ